MLPPPTLSSARVKQQARQLDARIARQGVAQIAVLPPRQRLDDQHPQLLLANRDRSGELVVVGDRLVGLLGNVERDGEVAALFGLPDDRLARAALRRDADFLGHFVAVRSARNTTVVTYSRGSELSIVNGIRTDLPSDAERRRVEAQQFDVRQALRAADRDGEDGHVRQSAAARPPRRAARLRSSRRRK